MTRTGGLTSALVAALLLVGCTGGDPEGTDTTSETSSSSTSSSSSSSTSEPTSAPTADQSTSTGAVVAFVEMGDELSRSTKGDMTDLSQVSRGEARKDKMQTLSFYRSKGWRAKGKTVLDDLRQSSSTKDKASVSVCVDYSELDVVDESGESVVTADRQERVLHRYTVERDAKTDNWFVTAIEDGGPTC